MTKSLVTDLDGTCLDFEEIANELGVGEEYEFYRNNTKEIKKFHLDRLDPKFEILAEKMIMKPTIYPLTLETFEFFSDQGFVIYGCTDNPILSINKIQEALKQRFPDKNGGSYLRHIHCTTYADTDSKDPRIRYNGSKVNFIDGIFRRNEKNVLVVDDLNDLDAASYARKLDEEHYNVFVAKVNENYYSSFEGSIDTCVKNFSDLTKNEKLRQFLLN